jgi:multidrug efflux pump subunit AcrB
MCSTLITVTKEEHPDKYGWWVNELESLGLSINKTNEFNDIDEIRNLAERMKKQFHAIDLKQRTLSDFLS